MAAPSKDAKKHVRPASRSADMLPKTNDRSDVYYDNRCRRNPFVSAPSFEIRFIITKIRSSSRIIAVNKLLNAASRKSQPENYYSRAAMRRSSVSPVFNRLCRRKARVRRREAADCAKGPPFPAERRPFLSVFGIYTGPRQDYNMGLERGGIAPRRAAGKV